MRIRPEPDEDLLDDALPVAVGDTVFSWFSWGGGTNVSKENATELNALQVKNCFSCPVQRYVPQQIIPLGNLSTYQQGRVLSKVPFFCIYPLSVQLLQSGAQITISDQCRNKR